MKRLFKRKETRPARKEKLICDENNDNVFHYNTPELFRADLRLLRENLDFLDDLFEALEEGDNEKYKESMLALQSGSFHGSWVDLIANGDRISTNSFSTTRPAIIEMVLCAAMLSSKTASVDIAFTFIGVVVDTVRNMHSDDDDIEQLEDEVRLAKQEAYAFACAAYKQGPALHMLVHHDQGGLSLDLSAGPPITLAREPSREWQTWA